MSKKSKPVALETASIVPASVMPRPLAIVSAALCAAAALLVVVLFVRALPVVGERARTGLQRVAEGACEGLRAEPTNAALGDLPAMAPDFKLKDYAGREVQLSSLRGSVVLVNFWATWCGTCVVEMPSMERLVKRLSGKPFRLLAISVDDDWAPVRKFFPQGTQLEVLLDTPRDTPKRYGTDKFPESFLIDKDGQIRQYVVSNRDWDTGDTQACIESLLD
ncbi:MAG: TlpA disulfide reductase family protein [Polyangia bacterium]